MAIAKRIASSGTSTSIARTQSSITIPSHRHPSAVRLDITPYRGCGHGWPLLLRPAVSDEYLGFNCGLDFETTLMANPMRQIF